MRLVLLLSLVCACATSHSRDCAPPPPPPEDPSLFELVPANAQAVVLIRKSSIEPLRQQLLDQDPALREELGAFLQNRVGTDVLGVDGLVGFATDLGPRPQVALLLHLATPPTGALKGTPAGEHLGTPLIALGDHLVAALVPAGVVLGSEGAVKAEIALSREQPTPGRGRGPLSALRAADVRDVPFIAAVDAAGISDPQTALVVKTYGLANLTFLYHRPDLVKLTVTGDAEKLAHARELLQQLITRGIVEAEKQKRKLVDGPDTLMGAGAIVGYHMTLRMFEAVTPKMVDGALVSEYHLPPGDSTLPLLAVAAAAAVPAFEKYLARSKASEGHAGLQRMKGGIVAWHAAHKRDGKRFAFPRSIDWTPPAVGDQCGPADFSAWKPLDFAGESTRFQYRFVADGHGPAAAFVGEARECGGKLPLRISGHVDNQLELVLDAD